MSQMITRPRKGKLLEEIWIVETVGPGHGLAEVRKRKYFDRSIGPVLVTCVAHGCEEGAIRGQFYVGTGEIYRAGESVSRRLKAKHQNLPRSRGHGGGSVLCAGHAPNLAAPERL